MDDYEKIKFFKKLINENKEEDFIQCMKYITYEDSENPSINTFDINIDSAYFFQKIYLHSCLKKRHSIAEYMEKEIYPKLHDIERISIRQCFPYGRYLRNK